MRGKTPPLQAQAAFLHEPQCEWHYGGKVRHPEFHPPLTLQNQGLGGMSGCEIHAGCRLGLVSLLFLHRVNCNSGIEVEPLAQLGPSLHVYFSPCSVIQGQKDEVTEEGERNEIRDLGGERPDHDFTPEKVTYIANISNSLKIEIQCLICKENVNMACHGDYFVVDINYCGAIDDLCSTCANK